MTGNSWSSLTTWFSVAAAGQYPGKPTQFTHGPVAMQHISNGHSPGGIPDLLGFTLASTIRFNAHPHDLVVAQGHGQLVSAAMDDG